MHKYCRKCWLGTDLINFWLGLGKLLAFTPGRSGPALKFSFVQAPKRVGWSLWYWFSCRIRFRLEPRDGASSKVTFTNKWLILILLDDGLFPIQHLTEENQPAEKKKLKKNKYCFIFILLCVMSSELFTNLAEGDTFALMIFKTLIRWN